MRKLNEQGWGVGTMIVFLCVFFLFLIIVGIVAFNFGIEKNSPQPRYITEEE